LRSLAREGLPRPGQEPAAGKYFCTRAERLTRLCAGAARAPVGAIDRFAASDADFHRPRTLPNLKGILFLRSRATAKRGERRKRLRARWAAFPIAIVDAAAQARVPRRRSPGGGPRARLGRAATQVLTRIGFPRRRALQTLLPLMRQMLDNFERLGPQAHRGRGRSREAIMRCGKAHESAAKISAGIRAIVCGAGEPGGVRVLSKNPGAKLRQLERALKNPRGGKN
jgi:hypothetical protein